MSISKWMPALGSLLAVSIASGAPLHAGDWYVDAQSGSNSNDGQSEATAWRTITFALGRIPPVPSVPHAIHVAPGVYDTQLGEKFPFRPPPLFRIVGTQGSSETFLDGAPSTFLVYVGGGTQVYDAQSGAQGLTLRNGVSGVSVSSSQGATTPAFLDLVIEHMAGDGIGVYASPAPEQYATVAPSFERVEVAYCYRGIYVRASAGSLEAAGATLHLTRAIVRSSMTDGIQVEANGEAGAVARMRRCRVVENGGNGVRVSAGGDTTSSALFAYASLFARNGGCGVLGETFGPGAASNSWFTDCTIAHNSEVGTRASNHHRLDFKNSILAGNRDDLESHDLPYATWSNCEDGDLTRFPNCIAADPLFVDPVSGDFRLRFASPCIDTGDPASSGEIDLLDHARPYDGDLDTLVEIDMGAFEFEPLHLGGTPRLGETLQFEFWGEPGAHARFLMARLPLIDPIDTPYGALYLDRSQFSVLVTLAIDAPPLVLQRVLPDEPALIGRTFSFQALTNSVAAPHGSALSNPITFLVEP